MPAHFTLSRSLATLLILWLCTPLLHGQRVDYEAMMKRLGLVSLRALNSEIAVELKYNGNDNFVGEDMYQGLSEAYLEKGFAHRISQAQRRLSEERPGYRLVVYDAARPMSVQKRMYNRVKGTKYAKYVAPATLGGRHNYGVAVDISILDAKGVPLDMGTPFDHFGEEAHVDREDYLVRSGKISQEARSNRALLERIMRSVGLRPYQREWWHYQEMIPMSEVRRRYPRLDF